MNAIPELTAFEAAHFAAIEHVCQAPCCGVASIVSEYLDFMSAGGWDVFAPADRVRLENRRPSWRVKARYEEAASSYALTLYLDVSVDWRTLRALEVFAKPGGDGGKQSMLERWLDDVAPIVSLALQRGADPEELARVIGHAIEKPRDLDSAVRDRGGRLVLEIAAPGETFALGLGTRTATVPASSPAAALVAAVHGVQHWLDEMPAPMRAAMRTALKPAQDKGE